MTSMIESHDDDLVCVGLKIDCCHCSERASSWECACDADPSKDPARCTNCDRVMVKVSQLEDMEFCDG
jgi:hypothetical protein